MKQVARFRRHDFGHAVAEALRARGMSIRDFTSAHPWISVSAVSRAMNAKPLATENILALCAELQIDPFEHFSVENQPVSAEVSRETAERSAVERDAARRLSREIAAHRGPKSVRQILDRIAKGQA